MQGFVVIASHFNTWLREGVAWHWNIDKTNSLSEFQGNLCTAELSRRPDSSLPYVLATDWFQKDMVSVLSQIDVKGNNVLSLMLPEVVTLMKILMVVAKVNATCIFACTVHCYRGICILAGICLNLWLRFV